MSTYAHSNKGLKGWNKMIFSHPDAKSPPKKPRVLYLITRAEPGGAQVHLRDLLEANRSQFELHLGVGEKGFLTEEATKLDVSVHRLPHLCQPLSPYQDIRAFFEVLALIKLLEPHLIHAHSSKAGLLGRLAARLVGVPVIFTAHGWAFTAGVPWRRKLIALVSERLAAFFSTRIITVSEADRQLALRYGVARPEQVITVHNGIPDAPAGARPGEQGEVRIVMVARFAPPKEQKLLVRALAEVKGLWKLIFIGDGPTKVQVQCLVNEMGLTERVEFWGTRHDVAEILAQAHVFALVSNWEGFPISILEAMRAGLPVVASAVGGVGEAVKDGETGFLIPRGDIKTLSEGLQRLVSDPELRARMGRSGRKRYEKQFTFAEMHRKILEVYQEACRVEVSTCP